MERDKKIRPFEVGTLNLFSTAMEKRQPTRATKPSNNQFDET